MSSLKKLALPATAALLAGALLVPAGAGAQRPGRDCSRNPNDSLCRQIKQRQEINDRQRGITPACRAAVNKYVLAKNELAQSKSAVGPWKTALKKATTKKAKKKYAKGLKQARARYKKAKNVNLTGFRTSADQACATAKVKPSY